METEAFVRWALDDARTLDDRFTVELLVDQGVMWWNSQRKIYHSLSLDELVARSRERKLNPAYEPHYSEDSLRKTAESLAKLKDWHDSGDRPTRSLEAFRFFPTLESLALPFACPTDISVLAELPGLRKLQLGYHGSIRSNDVCEDFSPLARCHALRDLELGFGFNWPDLTALSSLVELEHLDLTGNLYALPRGLSFPKVRRGALYCMPLTARDVTDLPQFPACEFLTLAGAQKLDGIEKMPRLRNLTILGRFRSFAPLTALSELTCLTVGVIGHGDQEAQPRDVAPLALLPRLHYFQIGPDYYSTDMPRDYAPLAEAPALRQLVVQRCPPVEMEVSAINAGLAGWDDLFLSTEPRALPVPRFILAPGGKHPSRPQPHLAPDEGDLVDTGLRKCEGVWAAAYAGDIITEQVGNSDWGTITANGEHRTFHLTVESFEVVERLPEIFDAVRSAIAQLRHEYVCQFGVHLRVRPPEPSPAQRELDDQLQEKRQQWENDQRERDETEYLERLHQLELKKQQGAEIDPFEFSPSEQPPYPQPGDVQPPPDEDNPDDYLNSDGDIAVKTEPDPLPPSWDDDAHPLANSYMCAGVVTFSEIWFYSHFGGIAVHLMQREPDLVIPEEKKPEE